MRLLVGGAVFSITANVDFDEMQAYSGFNCYHFCLRDLIAVGMPKARAKETARYFKLYNSQINSTKMFSFDGLMQVYFKRQASKGAQREISDMVAAMVEEVKNIPGNPFKASLEAFGVK